MKNRKTILSILAIGFLIMSFSYIKPKPIEVVIHTSAECGQCKERIESKLNYTKGIVFADVNYETRDLTVKFRPDKITLEEIKHIVSELGYDADDVKANVEAQNALPACCQAELNLHNRK